MENKHATYSPAFHLISWIALIGGIVTYLVGLWNADMQLNEKGYYFAVLVLGLFAAASYQKTVRDKYEAIPTTALYYTTCLVVFVIAVGLLVIGLWNATLLLSEKGFYGLAYFLSLPLSGNAPLFSGGGTRIAWDLEENYSPRAPDHILSMVML